MPAYNFKKVFADAVAKGEKTQTIRAIRKDGRAPMVSQLITLFTGMRTANCQKLGEGEVIAVSNVVISALGAFQLNGNTLSPNERDQLAFEDGFDTYADMVDFFDEAYGLPFRGHLIEWELNNGN